MSPEGRAGLLRNQEGCCGRVDDALVDQCTNDILRQQRRVLAHEAQEKAAGLATEPVTPTLQLVPQTDEVVRRRVGQPLPEAAMGIPEFEH
jgi:hypothetical protein